MTSNRQDLASRTALAYALCAALWILLSDQLLDWADGHAKGWNHLGTLKGLAFVAVTAVILYGLLSRLLGRLAAAETAVRAHDARWRLALDGIGDGMWDWEVTTGKVYYSPGLQAMLGYRPGEFQPTLAEWNSRLHPDDAAATHEALERHFQRKTEIYENTQRIRCRNGEYRWILDRGVVIEWGPDGKPQRMVGTHSDINDRKLLEARLQAESERYQMLFEQNPHPMWIYDAETRAILMVNDAAVSKYGYPRAEFLAKTILDLRPEDEIPKLLRNLAESRQPVQASGPWRHRLASGEMIYVEILSHSISWEGRAARVVVAHDVTVQQRVVHEIEESEQKFRAIFESANDAIFTADERYRLTDCNQRALEIFQATRAEIVGHFIPEFFPELQSDGSKSVYKARRVVAETWNKPPAPLEWMLRRPNGTVFDSEITVSGVLHEGRRSIVVVARDITERKRATEQLQLLQAALCATPAGVIITSADGTIDWVNPAFTRMTGYSLAEVAGRNPRVLRSGEHDADFYRHMWETIRRGDVWSGEIRNRRKDGTVYCEHMTLAPVRNAANHTTHYIAVKEDITDERQLEQQLARAQRLESVGMLASGIAHDLNNVLTPIILSVELLRSGGNPPQEADRLALIAQAAQRGANIVKQVLTFARGVDGERTTLQPRYFVKEVAQLAEETFPRSIEVHVEAGRDVSPVLGDITQLHQVLLNLAVNARDAMPGGGRLVFGLRNTKVDEARAKRIGRIEPGEFVEISVSDTGTGITEEVLEHMFEPFFTTKPRGKGTGLGLSTVYGIMRSHGGGVEVQSVLGRGTTFRLLMPIPRRIPESTPCAAAPPELRGGGRLLLLVDDEESIRVVGEHILRKHGFEVVTAADGLQALQLFRMRPNGFSLALVDQMMPRMGGTALIRELRALSPGLRVISSTGLSAEQGAEQSDAEDLIRLGVRTRLPKPYTSDELLAALRRELDAN